MNPPPRQRRGQTLARWVLVGVALAVSALIAVAVYAYSRPVVTVTEIVRAPVVQAFYATGTLSPERDYPIKTSVEGIVERLPEGEFVDKGSRVKKGQPLLKVVDPKLELTAMRAKAELEEKQARSEA